MEDEILSLGIDEVYCLSVNDAFVMRQVSFIAHIFWFRLRSFLYFISGESIKDWTKKMKMRLIPLILEISRR